MMPELWASWLIVAGMLLLIARRPASEQPLHGLWRMLGGAMAFQFVLILLILFGHEATGVSRLLSVVMAAIFTLCLIVPAGYLGARSMLALQRGGMSTVGAYLLSCLLVVVISTATFTAMALVAVAAFGFSGNRG